MPTLRQSPNTFQFSTPGSFPTPTPSARESVKSEIALPPLESSTIHLAHQLHYYLVQKSSYAHCAFLQEIHTFLETVVSSYLIPEEYGQERDYISTAVARYLINWVVDQSKVY
ncbi:hypothetical protein GJ744_003694 [Endocarpon pusillum]|uniref:Uncharacterized protein n=1 Tax=Endocarpon pusillum TaxID=364733 RepID=A0A8H7E0G5_9EURO|nr:hypothetical protein GJ744_003694 [Endocarpon pusillum]